MANDRRTADSSGTFQVLPPEKSCQIKPTRSPLWFQFNHRVSEPDAKRRHLGALIVVFGRNAGVEPIKVFRNAGWTRPNSDEVYGEFSTKPDLSWEQFAAIIHESSSPKADLRRVDAAFKGPWHAIPCEGEDYSWRYRKFWDWAVSKYETVSQAALGSPPQVDRFKVSARLFAFNPTTKVDSSSPFVFYVGASSGDSVFVALYSLCASDDTQSWYWIQLK